MKKYGNHRAEFASAAFPPNIFPAGAALNLLLSGYHNENTPYLEGNQGGGK